MTRNAITAAMLLLALGGCESLPDHTATDAVFKFHQLRDSSPQTVVWLENRTGTKMVEVGMSCESVQPKRSFSSQWTRETTIDAEPKQIWSEKYPDPIMFKTLWVKFENGAHCEYEVKHQCSPGDRVVLVVEPGGRVTAKAKE